MGSLPHHQEGPIIFFDGVCNLCNKSVRFVIKRDHNNLFYFAPLQSQVAKEVLGDHNFTKENMPDSIILLHQNQVYIASDAVIKIGELLGGVWKIGKAFKWIPRGVRDLLYQFVAKTRYAVFGQKEQCAIPSPEVRRKFLG